MSLICISYETKRWIPGYSTTKKDYIDTLVFAVKTGENRAYAFIFEFEGGWLLWIVSAGNRGALSFNKDLRRIERDLIRWLEDPH